MNSDEKFILGSSQVARYQGEGTGRIITKEKLINMYGDEIIEEINWYGVAVILGRKKKNEK